MKTEPNKALEPTTTAVTALYSLLEDVREVFTKVGIEHNGLVAEKDRFVAE